MDSFREWNRFDVLSLRTCLPRQARVLPGALAWKIMGPTYSIPLLGLFLIFGAGVVLGRFLRPTRINLARTFMPGSDFGAKRVRILKIKCQCGEEFEFRDPPDPSHPNSLAVPVGDSVTCAKCGRVIDLSEFRAKLPDAIGSD